MSKIDAIQMKIAEAKETLDKADMRCNELEYQYLEAE